MDTFANNQKIKEYINRNSVAVLGTINEDGSPHGATIYVYSDFPSIVYFVTKKETKKFKNLSRYNKVSLTINNQLENSTLQADGTTSLVEDPETMSTVMSHISKAILRSSDWMPPLGKIEAGPYQVVRIQLTVARLANYGGALPGDEHIFTKLIFE